MKKAFLVVMLVATMIFSASLALAAGEETLTGELIEKKAAENKAESIFSVSGEVWILSAYVGSMLGSVSYKGLVIQPMLIFSHNLSGLYAGAWVSYAPGKSLTTDNYGDNFASEVDLFAGWAKDINKFKFDVSYAYYKIFPLNEWGNGDVHAVNIRVDYALNKLFSPYAMGGYYYMIGQKDFAGFAYRAGTSINLHEHLKIDISVAGHSALLGAKEEPVSSGRISVSFPYKVKAITIIPQITYQQRFGYESTDGGSGLTESILYAGIGCTF